jgi:hypothetical protein
MWAAESCRGVTADVQPQSCLGRLPVGPLDSLSPVRKRFLVLPLTAIVINPLGSFGDSLSFHFEGRTSLVEGNSKSCHSSFLMGNCEATEVPLSPLHPG